MPTAYHRILCREIVITSANNTIIFREDGGVTDRTATIAAGTYYLIGANLAGDILNAIINAMDAGTGVAAGYGVNAAGPLTTTPYIGWTIGTDSTSFAFMSSGTTFPLADIGWDSADSGTFAATYSYSSSTVTQTAVYSPGVISSVQDPAGRTSDGDYLYTRPDGSHVSVQTTSSYRRWPLLWEYVSSGMSLERHEATLEHSYEAFWDASRHKRMRIYEGVVSGAVWTPTLVAEGYLDEGTRREMTLERDSDVPSFRVEGTLREDMT